MPRQDRRGAERRGRRAETLVIWFLRVKRYRILRRRLRTPVGEIDILARHRGVLVIVEVKHRRGQDAALEAVTRRQRERLERAATYAISRYGDAIADRGLRFDVVVVQPWRWPRHIRDAWRPGTG